MSNRSNNLKTSNGATQKSVEIEQKLSKNDRAQLAQLKRSPGYKPWIAKITGGAVELHLGFGVGVNRFRRHLSLLRSTTGRVGGI